MESVILVDEKDQATGSMEKMQAHKEGKLHRAFSIFIFNSKRELMLQQRAFSKYHSPGLWTNTCCSHPRPEETVMEAAHRRLKEEMGFDTELKEAFTFIYKAEFSNGLTEHELDHVLIGFYDGKPKINPEEVARWELICMEELEQDIKKNPDNYTVWLRQALPLIKPAKFK